MNWSTRLFLLLIPCYFITYFGLDPWFSKLPVSECVSHNSPVVQALRQPDYDLFYYELEVTPDLYREAIEAEAKLDFRVRQNIRQLRLLLAEEMEVYQVWSDGTPCLFTQDGPSLSISLPKTWPAMTRQQLSVEFGGSSPVAKNPPWTPGFVWQLDHKDRSWLTSVPYPPDESGWLPYPANDQADSAVVHITLPDRLMGVSNGHHVATNETDQNRRLRHTFRNPDPIFPSEIQLMVGYYQAYDTTFLLGDSSALTVSHFVKDYNLARASKHFQQSAATYAAWQHYLGAPCDSSKQLTLVEVPFSGFGNSGLINYGNRLMRGKFGGFIPRSMDWDYELVRNTAEQYVRRKFGYPSSEDRWLVAGWSTYLEHLYVAYHYGPEAARSYWEIYRPYLREAQPLVDPLATDFDLNEGEFQAKAGLLLYTISQAFHDEERWLEFLKKYWQALEDKDDATQSFINSLPPIKGANWQVIVDQYLHYRQLPVLQLRHRSEPDNAGEFIEARYVAQIAGFNLPVRLSYAGHLLNVEPDSDNWTTVLSGEILDLQALRLAAPGVLVHLAYPEY